MVDTGLEDMVDTGLEDLVDSVVVDTVMEDMVVTVMEALVGTGMEALVDTGMEALVDMGTVATDMDILETKAIIPIVHLLIKIMRIHSLEITNRNLTIRLNHMAKVRLILKIMPSLNRILRLKPMLNLKVIRSHKLILSLKRMIILKLTLSHKQPTLKLATVIALILSNILKLKLVIKNLLHRMDFNN